MGIFTKLFNRKKNVIKRRNNPDVYNMTSENERMNWSMEKARLTFHFFQDCLQHPKPEQEHLSIKARIEDNGKTEHIWLVDPSIDSEGNIFGVVGNAPIYIKNVQLHQKIGITKEYISDWMFIEDGRLIGGYTIRAIREGLATDQLENFDRSVGGMKIDAGEDYFLTNLETPEGAILSLEEAYNNKDITAVLSCKDFFKEAELLLHKSMNIALDNALISSTAEALKSSFIIGLKENGFPDFKGIKRAFKRFKITEEHYIITEFCYLKDGTTSIQKLHTYKTNEEWKVLGMED
ncbi:DUF2314 domain-containing protein [uncultured Maribacter sp.]|uniref:YegJ family protein n=1 Tax=uncultured Maribacter sp. TaxID=431308 RepID=UPI00260498B7|nr:DUF2314 domain-containing protein [uncultured Maribacter sp.]